MAFADGVVRFGAAALGAIHAWWGAWAWLAPANFFNGFPGLGYRWTAAFPPFNEHLVSDLGSTFLTLASLLLAAAFLNDRRVYAVVLGGLMVFSSLHLAYHLGHRGLLAGVDLAASTASLAAGVLGPAVLLTVLFRQRGRAGAPPPPR